MFKQHFICKYLNVTYVIHYIEKEICEQMLRLRQLALSPLSSPMRDSFLLWDTFMLEERTEIFFIEYLILWNIYIFLIFFITSKNKYGMKIVLVLPRKKLIIYNL